MIDYDQARNNMVDCQIRTCDVTEHALLRALLEIPREVFVPNGQKDFAYLDEDLPLDELGCESRYLMKPAQFARMVHLANIQEDDIVLDVGCATGYSSAILAKLCNSVVSIECDEKLAEFATNSLSSLEIYNAVVICDPLEDGYTKEAPYDVVFIGGSVDEISDAIFDQLKTGGKLVTVIGIGNAAQARLYIKTEGGFSEKNAFNASVKPLPGFEKSPEFVF